MIESLSTSKKTKIATYEISKSMSSVDNNNIFETFDDEMAYIYYIDHPAIMTITLYSKSLSKNLYTYSYNSSLVSIASPTFIPANCVLKITVAGYMPPSYQFCLLAYGYKNN